MGEVSRPLPTAPAPTSLRAAAGDGLVDWRSEGPPSSGDPDSPSRWHRSWSLRTPPCRPVIAGPGGCRPGDERDWDPARPLIFTGVPFGFEAQLECSAPADGGSLLEEARAAFDRGASSAIASELWSGTQAKAMIADNSTAAEGNRWLTRSDHPVSAMTVLDDDAGGVPLAAALGLIESYLACCSDVGRGVVHVPPVLVPPMLGANLLVAPTTPSGRRYTAGGHVLVADCGYTGDGPGTADQAAQPADAGTLWIYATGPLVVRVSPSISIGTDADVAEMLASTNDRVAVAGGLGFAAWGCCHAGVAVDVTDLGLNPAP